MTHKKWKFRHIPFQNIQNFENRSSSGRERLFWNLNQTKVTFFRVLAKNWWHSLLRKPLIFCLKSTEFEHRYLEDEGLNRHSVKTWSKLWIFSVWNEIFKPKLALSFLVLLSLNFPDQGYSSRNSDRFAKNMSYSERLQSQTCKKRYTWDPHPLRKGFQ